MATKKEDKKTEQPKEALSLQAGSVKQKIIRIHPMGLVSLLMTNNKIGIKAGIDAGTQYVGGGYDAATNCFFLHISNERFDDIKLGERLPDLKIELEDLNLPTDKPENAPTNAKAE